MYGISGELRFDGQGADVSAVRLSFNDPSWRKNQPMVDRDLGLTAAFKGCIYNHRDLRAEFLEGSGTTSRRPPIRK